MQIRDALPADACAILVVALPEVAMLIPSTHQHIVLYQQYNTASTLSEWKTQPNAEHCFIALGCLMACSPVSSMLCSEPQTICTMRSAVAEGWHRVHERCRGGESRVGEGMEADPPNWPRSPRPNPITRPSLVNTNECDQPAATLIT